MLSGTIPENGYINIGNGQDIETTSVNNIRTDGNSERRRFVKKGGSSLLQVANGC